MHEKPFQIRDVFDVALGAEDILEIQDIARDSTAGLGGVLGDLGTGASHVQDKASQQDEHDPFSHEGIVGKGSRRRKAAGSES